MSARKRWRYIQIVNLIKRLVHGPSARGRVADWIWAARTLATGKGVGYGYGATRWADFNCAELGDVYKTAFYIVYINTSDTIEQIRGHIFHFLIKHNLHIQFKHRITDITMA